VLLGISEMKCVDDICKNNVIMLLLKHLSQVFQFTEHFDENALCSFLNKIGALSYFKKQRDFNFELELKKTEREVFVEISLLLLTYGFLKEGELFQDAHSQLPEREKEIFANFLQNLEIKDPERPLYKWQLYGLTSHVLQTESPTPQTPNVSKLVVDIEKLEETKCVDEVYFNRIFKDNLNFERENRDLKLEVEILELQREALEDNGKKTIFLIHNFLILNFVLWL
jgi:hypothetical protein